MPRSRLQPIRMRSRTYHRLLAYKHGRSWDYVLNELIKRVTPEEVKRARAKRRRQRSR